MRNLKYWLIAIGLLFGISSCVMEDGVPEGATKSELVLKDWVEGRAYHTRGPDTTIFSNPYYRIEFNDSKEVFDTTWYQKQIYRRWDHKHSPDKEIEIYYWDNPSSSWYVFKRKGYYYSYKWRRKVIKLKNGPKE